jgi:hypothetical protein
MEIALFLLFAVFAQETKIVELEEQTAIHETQIADLTEDMTTLENGFIRLAAKHSAFYANQQHQNRKHDAAIDALVEDSKHVKDRLKNMDKEHEQHGHE